ncbi:tetratricopeptide repeat protein [bacterium]|nr:tetratricopeptide repeat protein [candidate division CSSED10-310 bacterium]
MNRMISDKIERGEVLSADELKQLVTSGHALKDIFKLGESDLMALMMVGYDLFNQGRYDDARTIFLGLEALGHDDPFVLTALGTIAARLDDLDGAEEYFNRAIDRDPEDMVALTNRAEIHLKRSQFDAAAIDLKRAIELDPDEESALNSRARILALVTRELMESVQETA